MSEQRMVSVTRVIPAERSAIFDLLADFRRHPEIDGSGTVKQAMAGPDRLSKGASFGMRMRTGLPYPIRNTVVEFEEGTLIAWRHFAGHRWRYELADVEGGTEVTETFDWSRTPVPQFYVVAGYDRKHPENMRRTLERLQHVLTTG